MDKDYLIQFNTDGTRLNTYANNIHYQIVEEFEDCIVDIAENFSHKEVINNGGIWFTAEDYNKLIGNVDGKEYIYKDGEIIEKPPYIPTAEEIQAQKEAELEQEYNTQLESFKNDMLVALLNNNNDAIKSIQEEIIEFNAAYVEAKEEIKGDAE